MLCAEVCDWVENFNSIKVRLKQTILLTPKRFIENFNSIKVRLKRRVAKLLQMLG